MNENNPYLKRLDQVQKARARWSESEWILSFLRSEGSEVPKPLTDEQALQWMPHLQ